MARRADAVARAVDLPGLPRSWQSTATPTIRSSQGSPRRSPRTRSGSADVGPDVALWMPVRILLAADQRLELGEEPQPRRLAQEVEARRDATPFSISLRHSSKTRSRARPSRPRPRHSATVAGSGVRSNLATNCMPRSTRSGSSAKSSETWRRRRARVGATAPGILDLAGQGIEGQRVDREVPARRGPSTLSIGSERPGTHGAPAPPSTRAGGSTRPRRRHSA